MRELHEEIILLQDSDDNKATSWNQENKIGTGNKIGYSLLSRTYILCVLYICVICTDNQSMFVGRNNGQPLAYKLADYWIAL